MDSVRLDKFLWAARLAKTRPEAADACRLGRVEMAGHPVKAGRDMRIGDILTVHSDELTKTVKITALLEKRIAGKLVIHYLDDLTPPEEYAKAKARREQAALNAATSPLLRPSKRDRRVINAFLQEMEDTGGAEPHAD